MVAYYLCNIYILCIKFYICKNRIIYQSKRIRRAKKIFCTKYSFFCVCRILLKYQDVCIRGPPHNFSFKKLEWRIIDEGY